MGASTRAEHASLRVSGPQVWDTGPVTVTLEPAVSPLTALASLRMADLMAVSDATLAAAVRRVIPGEGPEPIPAADFNSAI